MNKVFVLRPSEDWIVDRFVREWNADNSDISTFDPSEADVIWLLASWCWTELLQYPHLLLNKKVLTTVHHIVPEKFDARAVQNFKMRDSITTAYHVYNASTTDFISKFTNKPIHLMEYWANQNIWRSTGDKVELRKKYGLPVDGYLVGSFQRDTEGHDLKSPKLEKGPDLFVDAIEKMSKQRDNLHVVLGGWRRQYVISRLSTLGIPFSFLERPSQDVVNELYQTLDLYPVTSRCEGGPQSLIECGLLNIPVVSRNIGIANQVLENESIADDVTIAVPSIPNVESMKLPGGYEKYRKLIEKL